MKKMKKCLACLLAMTMVLTLLPSGVSAAEDDTPADKTPVCTCETVCTEDAMNEDCPVCGSKGAAPENCGQSQAAEQEGNGEKSKDSDPEDSASQKQSATEKVQTLIDDLPTVKELKAMNKTEQQAVYADLQKTYDAYEALSDAEKKEVTGAEIMDDLFAVFNGITNALADSGFTVTGGTSGMDYDLSGNTLTIKTNRPLTISGGTADSPINGQILIEQNVTANLTLNGVNLKGEDADLLGNRAKSAIELSSNSSLSLTLNQNTNNTLTGGSDSSNEPGAPAIHVPEGRILTVLCANQSDNGHICGDGCGSLSATGGSGLSNVGSVGIGGGISGSSGPSGSGLTSEGCGTVLLLGGKITVNAGNGQYGNNPAVDIGGADNINGVGGAGGTIIILTNVTSSDDTLAIGGGNSSAGQSAADNGAGIKPGSGDNTYEVYGNLSLPADLTIPEGVTLTIPESTTLTVPSGKTLTNYGTVSGAGKVTGDGTFTNHGVVNVTTNDFNNNTVAGAFNIAGGSSNTDYTYADGVLTVNDGANLTISMADGATYPTSDRIVVAANATATITLDGVKINAPQQTSAIDLSSGSKLTLILPTGTESNLVGGTWNTSDMTSSGSAGIHVPDDAELNIKCSENQDAHTCSESSCSKLSVKGNVRSAGIGGNGNESCGTVVIDGGVVTADGGAAGIGGGDHGSGGNITINGGIVKATGGSSTGAAGIGGAGENGLGGNITITGGIVTAIGNGNAAGIGGGWHSAGGTVIITGGVVQATVAAQGGDGAGIGGGTGADNGSFSTSTDSVTGHAVIFASSNLAGNEIGDDEDISDWSGVIFRGKEGKVYGDVTLSDSFEIPSGYTLTIPDGTKLTIPEGVAITNNGTIDMVDNGKIDPESRISGSGEIRQFYTVTFNTNGHGTAPENILAVKDSKITQPNKPTATGYTFDGWYKDKNCTTPWTFDTDTVTEKTTLYAKWLLNTTPILPGTTVRYIVQHYKEGDSGYILAETECPAGEIGDTVTAQPKTYSGYVYNAEKSTASGTLKELKADGDIVILKLYYDDSNAPEGTISVEDNEWGTFTEDISFRIFSKNKYDVTINAKDNETDVAKTEYLLSEKELSKTDLEDQTGWTAYDKKFSIENEGKYIIYVRITDKAGNQTYIRSNGLVLDQTAPVIRGIENGKTYCSAVEAIVDEKYLDKVTVNGKAVTVTDGKFTVSPAEGEQTIIAADKAGNETTYTVTVNNGHPWGEVSYEWKKTEDGYTVTAKRTCTKNAAHTQEATARAAGEVTVKPTCTEKGKTTYTAAFDAAWAGSPTKTVEDIDETGHDPDSSWTQENGKHYHKCKNGCGTHLNEADCSGGTATCTEKAKCTVCGNPYGEKDADHHTGDTEVRDKKEASCTENGYTGDTYCKACDAKLQTGSVIPAAGHTFEWKIDKKAQVGAAGAKHEECTVCGYAKEAVEIPALKAEENPKADENSPQSDHESQMDGHSPQAGDDSHMTLWLAVLLAAGAGLSGMTAYNRRKKKYHR